MIVDLVQVTTADGLRLDGAMQTPPAGGASQACGDAVLCLHGTGSNFYGSTLFAALAPQFLEWNMAVLAVNTRGHDGVFAATLPNGRRMLGSAYETVDDCRHDAAAWLAWLVERGYRRIAVLGHSLGAVKAIYSLAHATPSEVRCLLAVSPPRLSYSHFMTTAQAETFRAEFTAAEEYVRQGRGETLMSVRFPLPYLATAAGYVDKYGPAERYNFLNYLDRVACPMLFTFGTVELRSSPAFAGLPELLGQHAERGVNLRVAVIAGADHVYTACHAELAAQLGSWMRKLPGA